MLRAAQFQKFLAGRGHRIQGGGGGGGKRGTPIPTPTHVLNPGGGGQVLSLSCKCNAYLVISSLFFIEEFTPPPPDHGSSLPENISNFVHTCLMRLSFAVLSKDLVTCFHQFFMEKSWRYESKGRRSSTLRRASTGGGMATDDDWQPMAGICDLFM